MMQAGSLWVVMLTRTDVERLRSDRTGSIIGMCIQDRENGDRKMQKDI